MRIDDGGHVVFVCKFAYQLIYHYGRLGIQARIGFITKQVARIHYDGPGYAYTFLHPSAEFRRILVPYVSQMNPFQTKIHPVVLFCQRPVSKEIQRKTHVFPCSGKVKESGSLEEHPHLFVDFLLLFVCQGGKISFVVKDFTRIDFMKTGHRFQQDCLPGPAGTYDQICFPFLKTYGNI